MHPLITETDYTGSRVKCAACRMEVLQGQPAFVAQVGTRRQRVIHEGCADLVTDGLTAIEALIQQAVRYHQGATAPLPREPGDGKSLRAIRARYPQPNGKPMKQAVLADLLHTTVQQVKRMEKTGRMQPDTHLLFRLTFDPIARAKHLQWVDSVLNPEASESVANIEVLSVGEEFDKHPEAEDASEMEWYGTVRVRIGHLTFNVGAVIGVPESDRGSCRNAGSDVGPYLSAWYADSSDWSCAPASNGTQGVPPELAERVIHEINLRAKQLWAEVEQRERRKE